ncbi:glycosyltransferase [Croceicoccus sp. Ery15]|uniref:glycosyltransferase n=1 Tax=Croceicoccus sp. Ery15 TaxID=1703338 RepID=UPI001E301661|nr:glycosyltransferase [Croceicoccus sp. Ery15]
MRHLVLTRFNIASPGREVAIRNSPGWLDRRFDLFEKYCLPSMAGQANRNFEWLIYFDSGTPASFRERIERDRSICPFTPRYVPMFDGQTAAHDVRPLLANGVGPVLTTRLDNDDAVASDFIDRIQQEGASAPALTVLNFTNGIAMRDGLLYHAQDRSNPFTTLVEHDLAAVDTIWGKPHHQLGDKWTIRQVGGPPVWLQVVHGENVTNRIKGRLVAETAVVDSFRLADRVAVVRPGALSVAVDHAVLAPWRRLREAAFRAIKPLVVKVRGE